MSKDSQGDDLSMDLISRSLIDADIMEAEQNARTNISRILDPKIIKLSNIDIQPKEYSNSSSDDEAVGSCEYEPSKVYEYHHDQIFFKLPISQLEDFFKSDELDKTKPDRLCRILLRISEVHKFDSSSLFGCILFNSLSRHSKIAILESPNIVHTIAFPNIISDLSKAITEKKRHHSNKVIKHIQYDPNSKEGINTYLSILAHGNANLKSMVNILSNTMCSKCFNGTGSFISHDNVYSCVYADFGMLSPFITSYTLHANESHAFYMKSWDLSGSNDLLQWDIIHDVKKSEALNKKHVYSADVAPERGYRYYRLRQLAKNSAGTQEFIIGKIELVGSINDQDPNDKTDNIHNENLISKLLSSDENSQDSKPFFFSSDDHLYRILDSDWTNIFTSYDEINSYIIFDYMEKKVCPSEYVIKQEMIQSSFLRSWCLEGSNDRINWDILHKCENEKTLNAQTRQALFKCSQKRKHFYRFLRLRQTDKNAGGDHALKLTYLEFYGSLAFI